MTCQQCGERPGQETLKHEGRTTRVCRQCGNGIRDRRRPERVTTREKQKAVVVAAAEAAEETRAAYVKDIMAAQHVSGQPEKEGEADGERD